MQIRYKTRASVNGYTSGMKRKSALVAATTLAGGIAAWATGLSAATLPRGRGPVESVPNLGKPLRPPAHGPVQVGFVIGPELVAIDLFGPWTAFGSAMSANMMGPPLFNLYTVSASTEPLDVDGMKVQPEYAFENVPQPHVLVVPMQKSLPATIAYIKHASIRADVTMSVCTGAFLVAKAGLFDGLRATTHHDGYDTFAKWYPHVTLIRGPRYVENPSVSSSGGESCGIDLGLRVVDRYYGTEMAKSAAYSMEYRRTRRPLSIDDV